MLATLINYSLLSKRMGLTLGRRHVPMSDGALRSSIVLLLVSIMSTFHVAYADENTGNLDRLKALKEMKVTSVSRQPEDPFDAAAAVYVITKEDIRRSGATKLPEILRLAPGLQVAQTGSNWWAVSARGFNENISNKLLVLIDGRTIYNTFFSGTWWDSQDTFIDNIKQIEIIRGPGATLWGANAVNGVINIITEEAVNTIGKIASVEYGSKEKIATARIGGKLSNDSYYRTYAKYSAWDSHRATDGSGAKDGWDMGQVGFRVDGDKTDHDSFTVQGDAYNSNIDRTAYLPILTAPYAVEFEDNSNLFGGNLLGRWKHSLAGGSIATLQTYIDHTERNFSVSREKRTVFDVDFQHAFNLNSRNEITWGLGYRFIDDSEPFRMYFPYDPERRTESLYSTFIQDKITIQPNLFLTVGSKLEHNGYTGFELQPSARMAWNPTADQTIWGAVSRSIRSPSRFENDGNQIIGVIPPDGISPGSPAGFVRWVGNRSLVSETLISYELGYRVRPLSELSIDSSLFFNDYSHLRTFDPGIPFSTNPDTALPVFINNNGSAHNYGLELSSTWDVNDKWQLAAGYSYLIIQTDVTSGSTDTRLKEDEGRSPEHQFNVRSHFNLTNKIEMDNTLYYVSKLKSVDIPGYFRFDTRLAWKPRNGIELSLVGQNLLDDSHPEFQAIPVLPSTEVPRSYYGKLSLKF